MFDTTKDLRRVIIDTQQREKLVNDYRYSKDKPSKTEILFFLTIVITLCIIGVWGIHIIEGVCYG